MTNEQKHAILTALTAELIAVHDRLTAARQQLLPSEPFYKVEASADGWRGSCPSYLHMSSFSTIDEGPEMALSRIKDAVQAYLNHKQAMA